MKSTKTLNDYRRLARYYVRKYRRDLVLEDDLITNIVTAIIKAERSYSETWGTLIGYIDLVAKRTIISYIKNKHFKNKNKMVSINAQELHDKKTPEYYALKNEQNQLISFGLSYCLDDLQRQCVIRKHCYNQSYPTIGNDLNISRETARKRTLEGMEILRNVYEREDYFVN